VGQQHIQEPVVHIFRLWAFVVEQKLLLRLFSQNAVFKAVFIARNFQFGDAGHIHSLIVSPQFFFGVIPEHNAVLIKKPAKGFGNTVVHSYVPLGRVSWAISRTNGVSFL
jgi:hypothetical protein